MATGENKRKHLEFIQNVINRMNTNSFLIKGWSVTLVSALFALAAKDANLRFVWITYLPTPVFWGLDAYFLTMERRFRTLYDSVIVIPEDDIDFSMKITEENIKENKWSDAVLSKTIWPVYVIIIVLTLLIGKFMPVS